MMEADLDLVGPLVADRELLGEHPHPYHQIAGHAAVGRQLTCLERPSVSGEGRVVEPLVEGHLVSCLGASLLVWEDLVSQGTLALPGCFLYQNHSVLWE
jgi:hypothetical protein